MGSWEVQLSAFLRFLPQDTFQVFLFVFVDFKAVELESLDYETNTDFQVFSSLTLLHSFIRQGKLDSKSLMTWVFFVSNKPICAICLDAHSVNYSSHQQKLQRGSHAWLVSVLLLPYVWRHIKFLVIRCEKHNSGGTRDFLMYHWYGNRSLAWNCRCFEWFNLYIYASKKW